MIKFFVVVACCAVLVPNFSTRAATIKYTLKYDNMDIDEVLSNDRLITNYFKCLIDEGKCTQEGEELKRWLPDAIENKCEGCSDKQKQGAEKVITFLIQKKSDIWKRLLEKYDPQETFRQRYSELLETLKNKA